MSTPDKDVVNEEAKAARQALQDVATANFIAAADIAIADYANRGLFQVRLSLFQHVNLHTVASHYRDLGYIVSAPLPPNVGEQPAQLFGAFWEEYWKNQSLFFALNGLLPISEVYISWPTTV